MEQYLFNVGPLGGGVDGVVEIRRNVWLMCPEEVPPLHFTTSEVARFLRVGTSTVDNLIARGELRSVQVESAERIPASSLAEYVSALADGPDQ